MTKKIDQNAARGSGGGRGHLRPPAASKDALLQWRTALEDLTKLTPKDLLARISTANASEALASFLICDDRTVENQYGRELRNAELVADLYSTLSVNCGCAGSSTVSAQSAMSLDLNILKPLQVFEAFGTIDHFDASIGCGTIKCDYDIPDILLHESCLATSGYSTAHPGARIHCKAMSSYGNIQAIEIMSLETHITGRDNSTGFSSVNERTNSHFRSSTYWELTSVKKWSRRYGFGYLTRGEGTEDIYIDRDTIQKTDIANLRRGQTLLVRIEHGSAGAVACEIRSVSGTWPR